MRTTNNCCFSISSMTDSDLTALRAAVNREIDARNSRSKLQREKWINKLFNACNSHPNASCHTRGKLTIVAVYGYDYNTHIGTAFPIKGDKFDFKTGVAVAYAKAIGETVPDYI